MFSWHIRTNDFKLGTVHVLHRKQNPIQYQMVILDFAVIESQKVMSYFLTGCVRTFASKTFWSINLKLGACLLLGTWQHCSLFFEQPSLCEIICHFEAFKVTFLQNVIWWVIVLLLFQSFAQNISIFDGLSGNNSSMVPGDAIASAT